MAGPPAILKVGLTGGIASGKSTVAAILRELGAFVVDADEVARRLMDRGKQAYREVVDRFGDRILDDGGAIDRAKLAEIVFDDAAARSDLNGIIHPKVRAEAARSIAECARMGESRLAIYDAALLVETGADRDLHRLIVVRCREETQLERLGRRDGMSAGQAAARIAAQAQLAEKLAAADYVIDTDGSLDETRRQTEWVHASLLRDFEIEFGA